MRKRKGLRRFVVIVSVIVLFFAVINIIPPKKNVESNPFVVAEGELPMIAAHRGGSVSNPENTLLAFREAVNTIGVDILEGDMYLTKDGHLVLNHDSYVDETCNINGDISLDEVIALCKDKANRHYISDMTLAELSQYNFGYYFEDKEGNRIYKDAADPTALGLQMVTLEQLCEEFYESHPDLLFILEIKPSGDLGREACAKLAEILEKYPAYKSNMVIGTFNDEIELELKEKYPDILRGAPMGSAAKFVFTQYFGVNIFDNGDFACLQIPMSYDVGVEVPLCSVGLVKRAHRRNIAVQYWTINDADDMRRLIEMGVDCIMTDDPMLMKEILEEYK